MRCVVGTRLGGWLLVGCLLAGGCGETRLGFVPPLLLDSAGLDVRVSLASEPLLAGESQAGVLPTEAPFAGHILGAAAGARLELQATGARELALAFYGPRGSGGLFGAALAWTDGGETRAILSEVVLPAGGDFLVLVAGPAGMAYQLRYDCLTGCGDPPACEPLVCGLACTTGLARDAQNCPTCECAPGCQSDGDCPGGFTCQLGSCQRNAVCDCAGQAYDPVCGQDGVTYANECELACRGVELAAAGPCGSASCAADSDCPVGMVCQAGTCRSTCDCSAAPLDPVCGSDGFTYPSDCERRCAGVALDHLGPCSTCNPEVCNGLDDDCDGFVDEGCGGTACTSDADCFTGQLCDAATGLCSTGLACSTDADCPSGQTCQAGLCRPGGGCETEICDGLDNDCDGQVDEGCPACRSNADCAAGEVCDAATGRCLPDTCSDADGDGFLSVACGGGDCDDADAFINPAATEACGDGLDNDCDGQIDEDCGASCSSDSDCATGEVCYNGVCVVACRTDAECPAGQFCVGGICQP